MSSLPVGLPAPAPTIDRDRGLVKYEASRTCWNFLEDDDTFVKGIMGPIGSGKSVCCCWNLFNWAMTQHPNHNKIRRSRWAIIRNTYRELEDTTLQTWFDWFPRDLGVFREAKMTHVMSIDQADGTQVQAEFLFRALDRPDDIKKLLSLELSGAWINEAREVPLAILDMLQGRVARFPPMREGGPRISNIICDTNPPDEDHWWFNESRNKDDQASMQE
jgi:PBSX family phage terminase large subunit